MKILIIIIILLFNCTTYAGDLGGSLKKFGIMANVNKPGIVSDQLGGFMSGGSIHTRNQVSNVNLINMQLPSLNMGCGGIDLYSGGFGYINSAQLQALVKNIGSAAISYGSMLAIKTISPQIADLLSQLETMARFLNSQNINSCQMGASIAAGLWPKTVASQELACQAKQMGEGSVGNYFTSRYNCSKADKSESNKNEYKGLLGTEYNLVYHALKKQNPDLSHGDIELLMSISGTLISTPDKSGSDEGGVHLTHRNSLLKNAKLLESLVYGEQAEQIKLYKCVDKDKCLILNFKQETLKIEDSYLGKVKTLIHSIGDKFLAENAGGTTALTPLEKNLVETSTIPILKIISLETALKGHSVRLGVEEYAELIAFDYLISYLDNMLDEVYGAITALEYSQIDGEKIKDFKAEIRYVKAYLMDERGSAFEKMNMLLSVKGRMVQTEHMVKAAFAEFRGD